MNNLTDWVGEKNATSDLWLTLDARVYQRFQNVILDSGNNTTWIDHVLVSPYGLFVVETRRLAGSIYGSDNQEHWSQELNGQNVLFKNPLRKTFAQKKALAQYLGIPRSTIHTIVYFEGACQFKTLVPANVLNSDLVKHVKRYTKVVLLTEEINRIAKKLKQHSVESSHIKRDIRFSGHPGQ